MQARNRKGQALIETAVAGIVIVPLCLFLLDVAVLVFCNMSNDDAAKNAARAAANQPQQAAANQAANNAIATFKKSAIIKDLTVQCNYEKNEKVTAKTTMDVSLPVPFPGMSHYTFVAQSVQPIVAE
jgi:Flp pilus assembly protein TadG